VRLTGAATVLFLPWREYFPTSFTDQRVIANPAAQYFAGTVLASQNPGSGYAFAAEDPEHVFLDQVIGPPVDQRTTQAALAGLGVKFVALAKVAGWQDYADLVSAPGIHLVYTSQEINLYAVTPTAQEMRNDRRVRQLSPVDYQVLPGQPGIVPLPVPYVPGWAMGGRPARQLPDGQAGVQVPATGGVAHYGPSGGVLASEAASVVAALAMAGLAFLERRRRRRAALPDQPSIPGTGAVAQADPLVQDTLGKADTRSR